MVLIITLNPSVDLLYFEKHFALGAHNRFNNSKVMAAGKGINCARAFTCLGDKPLTLTAIAGDTGNYLQQLLKKDHFDTLYIPVSGETRHAITIMHDGETHTEIVEAGPKISASEKKIIFDKILQIIKDENISIVSLNGSVHSDDLYFYNDLIQAIRTQNSNHIKIVTDFSRSALELIFSEAEEKPDFIKPNLDEFNELTQKSFTTKSEIIEYLKKNPSPIPYTLVSCGEQGAVAQFNGRLYDVIAPTITLVNPTGSGDSTVAGAIYAFKHHLNDIDILRYAIASGTANAMEEGVGIINSQNFDYLLSSITVSEVG